MQDGALVWCTQVAGRRAHRSLGGAAPLAVFEAVEAAALQPLPARPFELAAWSTPKVAADTHITVAGALYSVPWAYIGRHVDAHATAQTVECRGSTWSGNAAHDPTETRVRRTPQL